MILLDDLGARAFQCRAAMFEMTYAVQIDAAFMIVLRVLGASN